MVPFWFVCGIAGFTMLDQKVEPGRIRLLTEAIRHRGPDQQGWFESPLVQLGAARLRIIDLAGGDQPIQDSATGTVIVFNGEVYNHAELRRELEERGHSFRTHSDTEVVLRSFLEWGTGCFSRFRGMFGAALWNERERRLVLARDRMGIKPLYLYRRGRDVLFGSELKNILLHPEVPRRLNLDALSLYLALNWTPAPGTLVDGIEKLWPGEWLEWRAGEVRRERYFVPKVAPRTDWTWEEAKAELDRLLRASVAEHLLADVPLGVWASGGLDSSTIVHYATQSYPGRLKTFSVSFRGQRFDESPWFREVAAKYGTDHHEFDLNPGEDLAATIEQIPYYSDEPSADAGALPVWFLSKMCRSEVTVALSGEGADELFGGYYTYVADRLAPHLRRLPAGLRRLGLSLLARWPVSDDKISFEYKAKRFLAGSLLSADAAHFFWNGTFGEAERRALYRAARYPNPEDAIRGEGKGLSRQLEQDQNGYLPDDILVKCDRMSMAHSLEVRPPFLDPRLVDFANSLPEDFKIRGSELKYVLRGLMRDKLPAAVLTRKKEGFDIPAHAWFRGPLRGLLHDTLTPAAVRQTGVFNAEQVARIVEEHQNRKANHGYPLWGLTLLFLWMKRWKIEAPAA